MLAIADGAAVFASRSDDGVGQAGGFTMDVARDGRSRRTAGQGRLPGEIPTGHKPKLLDQLRQAGKAAITWTNPWFRKLCETPLRRPG